MRPDKKKITLNNKTMNKGYVAIIIGIVVLLLAGVGYAIWSNSQTPGVAVQTPTTTTTTTTTPPPSQTSAPTVKTDATTAPYISTVVVKGIVNPNGLATTYWFEYGTTSTLGTQTTGYLIGSGFANIYAPAYIVGLAPNTNYFFRLNARNSMGASMGATYTFKTNSTPLPQGAAPTTSTTSATDVARTTANLHGKVNPAGAETTYWFEYGTTTNLGSVTSFQTTDNNTIALTISVPLSNLQPLTKYYFRLNAQNQFGTVNGEIVNFTTTGPATAVAPTVSTALITAITSSSAKLNASVNPNGAETMYWFEYSTNATISSGIVTTPEQLLNSGSVLTTISATINNLKSDTNYYIRVVAKNQYGTVRGDIRTFTSKK